MQVFARPIVTRTAAGGHGAGPHPGEDTHDPEQYRRDDPGIHDPDPGGEARERGARHRAVRCDRAARASARPVALISRSGVSGQGQGAGSQSLLQLGDEGTEQERGGCTLLRQQAGAHADLGSKWPDDQPVMRHEARREAVDD